MEIGCEKTHFLNKRIGAVCWTWCLVPSIFRWLWGDKGFSNTAFMSLLSCTLWMENQQHLEALLAPFSLCSQDQNILQQCNFQLTYLEAKWKQRERLMAQETLKRTIAQSWDELEHVKCNNLGGRRQFSKRNLFHGLFNNECKMKTCLTVLI